VVGSLAFALLILLNLILMTGLLPNEQPSQRAVPTP
jgi:hypothetical protein